MTEEVPWSAPWRSGSGVRTVLSVTRRQAQAGVSHFLEHLLFRALPRATRRSRSPSASTGSAPRSTPPPARRPPTSTPASSTSTPRRSSRPAGGNAAGPDLSGNRLRAPGGAGGDRDVRRRALATASTTSSPRPSSAPTRWAGVLGEAEVIASIPVPDIEDYRSCPLRRLGDRRRRRWPSRPRRIVELAQRLVQPPADGGGVRPRPRLDGGGRLCFHHQGDRAVPHLLRRAGPAPRGRAALPLAVLDAIFGWLHLFPAVPRGAQKRGLAYSVGSANEQFTDQGLVATYVGTREDNVEEACEIIGTELARLRSEPVSAEELTPGQGERQGSPRRSPRSRRRRG